MNLYQLARLANTISNPTPTRAKNIALGRVLARGGFWAGLWRALR